MFICMKPSQRQTGDGSRSVDPPRFSLEWNGRDARSTRRRTRSHHGASWLLHASARRLKCSACPEPPMCRSQIASLITCTASRASVRYSRSHSVLFRPSPVSAKATGKNHPYFGRRAIGPKLRRLYRAAEKIVSMMAYTRTPLARRLASAQ